MKKKLALVLAAVLMFAAFAGCSGSGSGSSASPSPSASAPAESQPAQAGELNVAVFYYNYSDVYISSVRNNMDEMLTALGVNYDNFDGAGNQSQQTDQINTALANGANLLIVNIVETSSPDAAQNAVNAAKDAGIPIIFFNREVSDDVVNSYDKCAFVGTDAPEAGHMQGKLIGEYLLANYEAVDLNGDGVISYVMFKGQEGNAEAEARTQFGVEDADTVLTGAGKPALAYYAGDVATKYQVDQNGSWSAAAAVAYMDTILAEYSEANGNMVELVIANNDDMALGAISSLQTAGYNLGDGSSNVVALSLSLGLRFFEITIFLLICDISKNFALPAVLLFGIEEAVIIFRSAGVGVGSRLDGLAALGVSPSIVIAVGIALVIAATLLLFNDRELSSQWKVSLFGPGKIQQGKERRELVEAACARVAEDYGLTAREREILLLLSDGKTTKQIGERLCIAKGTVKAHTEHIYAKTGINSRKQLMDLLNVD